MGYEDRELEPADRKIELTERELTEIRHSLFYAQNLHHGTAGHNLFMLVAKLSTNIGFSLDGNTTLVYPADRDVIVMSEKR